MQRAKLFPWHAPSRVFDGSFGRLQLLEAAAGEPPQTAHAPQIIDQAGGRRPRGAGRRRDAPPDARQPAVPQSRAPPARRCSSPARHRRSCSCFQASGDWLRGSFPAVFDAGSRPFAAARRGDHAAHPPARRHARDRGAQRPVPVPRAAGVHAAGTDALDRGDLPRAPPRRRARCGAARPSPTRASARALALLRAHPNKDVNMNDAGEPGRPVALALLRPVPALHRPLAALLPRHAVRRVGDLQALLGQRQDRRGLGRTRLFRAIEFHPLLPAAGRHPALRVPARGRIKPNTDPQDEHRRRAD